MSSRCISTEEALLSHFTIILHLYFILPSGNPCDNFFLLSLNVSRTQVCLKYCASRNAAYFGLQWGVECWCGKEADDYTRHGVDDCDFACGGEDGVTCGGYDKMDIFEIDY